MSLNEFIAAGKQCQHSKAICTCTQCLWQELVKAQSEIERLSGKTGCCVLCEGYAKEIERLQTEVQKSHFSLTSSAKELERLRGENAILSRKTTELSLHPCCCEERDQAKAENDSNVWLARHRLAEIVLLRAALEKIAKSSFLCDDSVPCPWCDAKEALAAYQQREE